ncbi:TerC family protein [Ferviditalea candida]|uniref:TerC family protein n=1 Tax=Ferviditalea candida TaxID=3108399 RepID=A0ABU5ZHT5_9BACL|nr:TerC family protein [Paenibacillaceae bacterium T2]
MLEGFLLFLEIMLINIVLSGDNAVVIAMASKNLPLDQRKKAVWWGAFGAVALRLVLTVVAVVLLKVPYIQAAGSLLLMYIALKLLMDDEGHSNVKEASSLAGAVWTIIVADFIMSLDNVLAIAAVAEGDLILIILGIGLSIPLIIWGSTLIMKLLHKYPILVYIGAGILGYTAGEMLVSDQKVEKLLEHANPAFHWLIPVATTLIVIGAGLIKKLAASKSIDIK